MKFREELVARLCAVAPLWPAMSDADLSKLLTAQRITTATGLRFDPTACGSSADRWGRSRPNTLAYNHDAAAVAEKMRLWLVQITGGRGEPISDERRAEIQKQLQRIGLTLLEECFANHALLQRALAVAEKAFHG